MIREKTSVIRKRHLFLGGFASESIMIDLMPDGVVEIMYHPDRYSADDFERVQDQWKDGVYSYRVDGSGGNDILVYGTLLETIMVLRSSLSDMAPRRHQIPPRLEDPVRTYREFRSRARLPKPRRRPHDESSAAYASLYPLASRAPNSSPRAAWRSGGASSPSSVRPPT